MTLAAFRRMLERDRKRRGFTIGQVAWRLGITPDRYQALEAGEATPDFETWDRICKLYGWPQTFTFSRGTSAGGPASVSEP